MKKISLLLCLVYFNSTTQIHKPVVKSNDPCQVITMEKIRGMDIKVYSTNITSVKPKYKLYYEKWVGPGDKVIYY